MESKLVLFVNKHNQSMPQQNADFCRLLRPEFHADVVDDFNESAIRLIMRNRDQNISSERYNALITHFPYDRIYLTKEACKFKGEEFYRRAYHTSSILMKKLKAMFPDLPVLVYSGIGIPGVHDEHMQMIGDFLKKQGVDDYVFKSRDMREDADLIKQKLIKRIK